MVKVSHKRFTWEKEVEAFCSLYVECIISIVWDGNNPENPYVVFYKEIKE